VLTVVYDPKVARNEILRKPYRAVSEDFKIHHCVGYFYLFFLFYGK